MGKAVEVEGLVPLVKELKGPLFRDVNRALRYAARDIADEMVPHISLAVRLSPAPQAKAMSATVRSKPDRIPVVIIGRVNPKFSTRFTRSGSDSKKRRGSMAHGVVYGPAGGKRSTPTNENFYKIPRDESGGALGKTLKSGTVIRQAEIAYLEAFLEILADHGFDTKAA